MFFIEVKKNPVEWDHGSYMRSLWTKITAMTVKNTKEPTVIDIFFYLCSFLVEFLLIFSLHFNFPPRHAAGAYKKAFVVDALVNSVALAVSHLPQV